MDASSFFIPLIIRLVLVIALLVATLVIKKKSFYIALIGVSILAVIYSVFDLIEYFAQLQEYTTFVFIFKVVIPVIVIIAILVVNILKKGKYAYICLFISIFRIASNLSSYLPTLIDFDYQPSGKKAGIEEIVDVEVESDEMAKGTFDLIRYREHKENASLYSSSGDKYVYEVRESNTTYRLHLLKTDIDENYYLLEKFEPISGNSYSFDLSYSDYLSVDGWKYIMGVKEGAFTNISFDYLVLDAGLKYHPNAFKNCTIKELKVIDNFSQEPYVDGGEYYSTVSSSYIYGLFSDSKINTLYIDTDFVFNNTYNELLNWDNDQTTLLLKTTDDRKFYFLNELLYMNTIFYVDVEYGNVSSQEIFLSIVKCLRPEDGSSLMDTLGKNYTFPFKVLTSYKLLSYKNNFASIISNEDMRKYLNEQFKDFSSLWTNGILPKVTKYAYKDIYEMIYKASKDEEPYCNYLYLHHVGDDNNAEYTLLLEITEYHYDDIDDNQFLVSRFYLNDNPKKQLNIEIPLSIYFEKNKKTYEINGIYTLTNMFFLNDINKLVIPFNHLPYSESIITYSTINNLVLTHSPLENGTLNPSDESKLYENCDIKNITYSCVNIAKDNKQGSNIDDKYYASEKVKKYYSTGDYLNRSMHVQIHSYGIDSDKQEYNSNYEAYYDNFKIKIIETYTSYYTVYKDLLMKYNDKDAWYVFSYSSAGAIDYDYKDFFKAHLIQETRYYNFFYFGGFDEQKNCYYTVFQDSGSYYKEEYYFEDGLLIKILNEGWNIEENGVRTTTHREVIITYDITMPTFPEFKESETTYNSLISWGSYKFDSYSGVDSSDVEEFESQYPLEDATLNFSDNYFSLKIGSVNYGASFSTTYNDKDDITINVTTPYYSEDKLKISSMRYFYEDKKVEVFIVFKGYQVTLTFIIPASNN